MLTHRRFEVAKLVAETGLGFKEIASQLHIEECTVKRHMEFIRPYFKVHSRLALALEWSKHLFQFRTWESYLAWHRRHYARGTDNR